MYDNHQIRRKKESRKQSAGIGVYKKPIKTDHVTRLKQKKKGQKYLST